MSEVTPDPERDPITEQRCAEIVDCVKRDVPFQECLPLGDVGRVGERTTAFRTPAGEHEIQTLRVIYDTDGNPRQISVSHMFDGSYSERMASGQSWHRRHVYLPEEEQVLTYFEGEVQPRITVNRRTSKDSQYDWAIALVYNLINKQEEV